MIDVSALLNPDFQNPELRAYAYLSVQYRSGLRSPLDCLKPFAVYAISSFSGDQLNLQDIRNYLQSKYRINVPFYMLERMQTALLETGALERTTLPGVMICRDARPKVSGNSVDFSITDIENLGHLLSGYASARGLPAPATAANWADVILPFFLHTSPPADKAGATVKGVMVSDPKSVDFAVVADFIMEQYRSKTPAYKTLERLYYGVLAANFLTQIESVGDKSSFKDLTIIYDTPLLIRLLGCSGVILKEATEELHDMLRDMGCRIYYFAHSYDELTAAIEAMIKCHEAGKPLFRDTQEAIARGEISIAHIYSVKAELDLKLAALGITEHPRGYSDRGSDEFQIDEEAFQRQLETYGRWGADGSLASRRDAVSLGLVMRLRNGKEVREVAKANVVFLTHNPRLADKARRFLRDQDQLHDGAVWPIMTVGQMSTIAWVANEVFLDENRITKELIADCYAAALPDEDFDEKLREVLTRTDPKQAHELYQNAFLVQSIRQVALEQTGGHSALVRTLNTSELVAKAEEVRDQTRREAWRGGWEEASAAAEKKEQSRREEKVSRLAKIIAKFSLAALFIICATIMVLGTGILGENWKPGPLYWGAAAVVAVYSAMDLFGFSSAASLSDIIESTAVSIIRRLQSALA